MPPEWHFGATPGVSVGDIFQDRAALAAAGVHAPTMLGIWAREAEGAASIVMSGGYEDDEDHGEWILYTGHGGNDPSTGRQIEDQKLHRGNLGLYRSQSEGLPIRVSRGSRLDSHYAPEGGYRYDGLYFVSDAWTDTGKSGYRIFRYRLERDDPARAPWESPDQEREPPPSGRRETTVQRIVRCTLEARRVKEMHDYRCQICAQTLETPIGLYAEAAHVKPLGSPHGGPDISANILCLCPNHHVLFDSGSFCISDSLELINASGFLRTVEEHKMDREFFAYHRDHIFRGD